jgi:hypothetical protein
MLLNETRWKLIIAEKIYEQVDFQNKMRKNVFIKFNFAETFFFIQKRLEILNKHLIFMK